MRSEKELFKLARDMVYIEDKLQANVSELMREELTQAAAEIRAELLKKNYDVNTFLHYKEIYPKMTVSEYYAFLDTLDGE